MKYYIYRIKRKGYRKFGRAEGPDKRTARKNIEDYEVALRSEVTLFEVSKKLFSYPILEDVFHHAEKLNKTIYTVNRKAVDVMEYIGQSVRVKFKQNQREATVHRSLLRSFVPKGA